MTGDCIVLNTTRPFLIFYIFCRILTLKGKKVPTTNNKSLQLKFNKCPHQICRFLQCILEKCFYLTNLCNKTRHLNICCL